MKKKIGLILLGCLFVFVLSACGKEKDTPTGGTEGSGKEDSQTPDEGSKAEGAGTDNADTEGDGTDAGGDEAADTTETGFVFKSADVEILMNAPAAPILTALGKETQYFEAESCAFQGLDKIYYYPGFELHTYPTGDADYVAYVIFSDDSITTPEGLYLGAPETDVVAMYGGNSADENGMYKYTKGDSTLTVIVEAGVVSSIEYGAVTASSAQ